MSNIQNQIKTGVLEGIKKGWASFLWVAKFVIPLSLLVALLQWSGWLNNIYFLLTPLTRLINLPPEAAIPIISGIFINLYACIAVITVLPFTTAQMTLVAVFSLIAHNMILEGTIQHKAGINWAKISVIRILAAIVTVLVVSRFMGDTSQSIASADLAAQIPLLDAFNNWLNGTLLTLGKIFGIVMAIMIALGLFKSLGWIDPILRFFRPLGKIFGIEEHTVMMFMAAIVFGLLYGGAVIVEEARKEPFTKEELEYVHISIGINHSMLEDPALFTVLGLHAFWMWVPKLITAIVFVQAYRVFRYVKARLTPRPVSA